MGNPAGMSEEDWEATLEERAANRARERMWARIEREGFEINGFEPDDSERCQTRKQRKVRGRWAHEPCGEKAAVVLHFAGPDNPEGTRTPLCRSCLAHHAKDLIGYLENT